MASPQVSILIPAYYSDDTLPEFLEGLRRQRFRDFEVIIVNSSPGDSTRRIVESEYPEAVFVQSPMRLLPHGARNRAEEHSHGEILVFSDPDCRSHPEWLERLVAAHKQGHCLVCGSIELGAEQRGWFSRGVHLCKYSFRLSGLPPKPAFVAGTANASCTREVWQRVGPFDGGRFAGDALFSWRAAAQGWPAWFEPRAIVEHRYIGTIGSLWIERVARGDDFADARVEFERWSRARIAGCFFATPLLIVVVLVRGAREAMQAGWGRQFLLTLPLQILGHAAWSLGEARTYLRLLFRRQRVER